uniref:MATH domain-containing protein n=1 Tax=Ditylenchus dipsaci TaxID=166011 RepID=A0A915EGF3_9BILA
MEETAEILEGQCIGLDLDLSRSIADGPQRQPQLFSRHLTCDFLRHLAWTSAASQVDFYGISVSHLSISGGHLWYLRWTSMDLQVDFYGISGGTSDHLKRTAPASQGEHLWHLRFTSMASHVDSYGNSSGDLCISDELLWPL